VNRTPTVLELELAKSEQGPVIDFSPYEASLRRDVSNLAHAVLAAQGVPAEEAFARAKRFYEIKERFMKTGELPE